MRSHFIVLVLTIGLAGGGICASADAHLHPGQGRFVQRDAVQQFDQFAIQTPSAGAKSDNGFAELDSTEGPLTQQLIDMARNVARLARRRPWNDATVTEFTAARNALLLRVRAEYGITEDAEGNIIWDYPPQQHFYRRGGAAYDLDYSFPPGIGPTPPIRPSRPPRPGYWGDPRCPGGADPNVVNYRCDLPGCLRTLAERYRYQCCLDHDNCYAANNCNSLSWLPGCGSRACKRCNRDVVGCFIFGP
jgi:hypothetical protein